MLISRIFFLSAFLCFLLGDCAFGQVDNACSGAIGGVSYSLRALQRVTKGLDQKTVDSIGNTYYYRPCAPVAIPDCVGVNPPDDQPAVCQNDSRRPDSQFHDCGSLTYPLWSARSTGPATGFFLKFFGGQDGRTSEIEFICNLNVGVGFFRAKHPAESPLHEYHFVWETSYACPL